MPKYYIQAEAFNLDNIISDTYDISTIRGGSFMLLDAVKRLPMAIPALKSIATAASMVYFPMRILEILPLKRESWYNRFLGRYITLPKVMLHSWWP